jgi:hypothetical protein
MYNCLDTAYMCIHACDDSSLMRLSLRASDASMADPGVLVKRRCVQTCTIGAYAPAHVLE